MKALEGLFESACSKDEIAGVVLVASAGKDVFKYQKAFGDALREYGMREPYSLDTVFWIASSSKLITSIAAMQCVERGQLRLDDDVTGVLHELKDIQLLNGFDTQGAPVYTDLVGKITLRHLLSHSSGLGYDIYHPLLVRWRQHRKEPVALTGLPLVQRSLTPVINEPGSDWEYSTGIDWAGEMVRRVNCNISLEEYLRKNIWDPLGIQNMTFHLEQRPDLERHLSPVTQRSADSGTLSWATFPISYGHPVKDDFGGGGLYATAPDYLKLLESICYKDGKILQAETVDTLFQPQLGQEAHDKLNSRLQDPAVRRSLGGGTPPGIEVDSALGGLLSMEDVPERRRKGTMSWGGLPNLKWWIDPESQVCGFYACQLIPAADPKSLEMFALFEQHVYSKLDK